MAKKIFISYSWGNKEYQDWIVNIGNRLMNDSVDVILDRWSLKDGHDIHAFMEEMVKSEDIFRVLIVCDKNYKEKADERKGGVGTETQIITPEIYGNQKQEKFIPIVVERDSDDKPYLPIFLSSRKYIDFSSEEFFEDSYEELLRNILEAPAISKPKLGTTPPLYITDNAVNTSEINSSLRTLENQINKHPEKIDSYISNFIDLFLDKLWDFEFHTSSRSVMNFGNELYDNLLNYKTLRDEFISFLLVITQPDSNLDVDELISFFEKQPLYLNPKEARGSWCDSDYDNFKIIFHELFIYTIAACLKNKNYHIIEDLLFSRYHKKDKYKNAEEPDRYTFLYNYHENLENYISTKYQKISGFGYYVIANLNNKITKELLTLADTICYIVGELYKEEKYTDKWFPLCFIYKESKQFDFFCRLDSKRHFEKVKGIFGIETPQSLVKVVSDYQKNNEKEQRIRYSNGSYIPFVHELIKIDKISINR
jgi:hypothetical protein